MRNFGHLPSAPVVYQGPFDEQLVNDVREGKYPVAEGVVAKGVVLGKKKNPQHGLWMSKVKTKAWLAQLRRRADALEFLAHLRGNHARPRRRSAARAQSRMPAGTPCERRPRPARPHMRRRGPRSSSPPTRRARSPRDRGAPGRRRPGRRVRGEHLAVPGGAPRRRGPLASIAARIIGPGQPQGREPGEPDADKGFIRGKAGRGGEAGANGGANVRRADFVVAAR